MTRLSKKFISVLVLVALPAALDLSSRRADAQSFPTCRRFDGSCLADPVPRDWEKCPAILEVEAPGEIFVVGDVHGQYESLVALLAVGGIIARPPDAPEEVEWTAGDAVLVTPGDSISKGEQSLLVISLLRALEAAAGEDGGRVIATMGNHEAEFLADPCVGKARKFKSELCASGIDPESVAAGSDERKIGEALHCRPMAAKVTVDDRSWFFSHAGSSQGRSLDQLRSDIEAGVGGADYYRADVLLGKAGLLEARLKPPWWEVDDDPEASKAQLARWVENLGVQHLVIGHQPGKYKFNDGARRRKGEIFQRFGLIFLLDAGVIKGYSDGALLRLETVEGGGARATVIEFDGSEKTLWASDSSGG